MKKRILIICPSNKGTIAICTLNLWKALQQTGLYDIKCILMYKLADGISDFDGCEAFIEGRQEKGVKRFFRLASQTNWVRKQKQCFNPNQTISTLFSCSAFNVLAGGKDIKIGIFHSPHQQVKSQGRISYTLTLFYYNFLFPRLDRLFCVSREVKDSIEKSFPRINPEKISVVYNAHDESTILNRSNESLDNDVERSIFASDVILYVGRFDHNKAPERALDAFIKSGLASCCQLVFIGGETDSDYTQELKNMAKTYDIENRVHFLGSKQNPYKYMARSKALVSCSYSEGLPGVIIESQILGKPVVTTNSSFGVWEILSCPDEYADIQSNHVTPFGIITPNRHADSDIEYLADAMTRIVKECGPMPASPFIKSVSFTSIADKYGI